MFRLRRTILWTGRMSDASYLQALQPGAVERGVAGSGTNVAAPLLVIAPHGRGPAETHPSRARVVEKAFYWSFLVRVRQIKSPLEGRGNDKQQLFGA